MVRLLVNKIIYKTQKIKNVSKYYILVAHNLPKNPQHFVNSLNINIP